MGTGMSFLQPQHLNLGWALVAFVLWCGFALYGLRNARRALGAMLYGLTSRPSSLLRRGLQMLLVIAVLGCLILAAARPQTTYYRRIAQFRQTDAVILLDTSPSMRAQDIQPSRLFRSTEVIAEFLDRLVMTAVHADFAAAVNVVHARVRFEQDDVAMRAAGRIEMWEGLWHLFRQVKE